MIVRATLLALLALPLLATWAPRSLMHEQPLPQRARVWFEPVSLAPEQPGRSRVGRLVFLQGWSLRSNDRRLGGISAIHVEGGDVTAVTDSGSRLGFRLPRTGNMVPLEIGALGDSAGSKRSQDSEALVVAGDRTWVAFERGNRVQRFVRPAWALEAGANPEAMRRWRANIGAEAMVRLPDGRFLVFAEGRSDTPQPSDAILFHGDPAEEGTATTRFRYARPDGFRVTDAALLPDGRLLILNRRFSLLEGISAQLVVADVGKLEEGAVLAGEEIAHLEPPITVDNMEGLSIEREGGRTIVWIASDDNFMNVQRSLLLKFALAE